METVVATAVEDFGAAKNEFEELIRGNFPRVPAEAWPRALRHVPDRSRTCRDPELTMLDAEPRS